MAKVHIGLVSEDKNLAKEIQKICDEVGGGYIHQAKTIFELIQKMTVQKMQVVVLVLRAEAEAVDFKAAYSFLRGKHELAKTPICVLTENLKVISPVLVDDPLIRAYPISFGLFVSIHSALSMANASGGPEMVISDDWIQSEFLQSLKLKAGQNLHFDVRQATDDERRTSFYAEKADEVRTHLGWFKFTARMIESSKDGVSKMFVGMSRESIEEFAQILLEQVVLEFNTKVDADFTARGAIFLPEIEVLTAAERKYVYSKARYNGVLFEAPECTILLETCRYL